MDLLQNLMYETKLLNQIDLYPVSYTNIVKDTILAQKRLYIISLKSFSKRIKIEFIILNIFKILFQLLHICHKIIYNTYFDNILKLKYSRN